MYAKFSLSDFKCQVYNGEKKDSMVYHHTVFFFEPKGTPLQQSN